MSNSDGLIKREDLHESLLQELDKVNTVAPAVGFGMNNVIKNSGKVSALPKFTIKGRTIVNAIGRDGNCEDVSRFNDYQVTHSLDLVNKVFGNNGMKVTIGTGFTYGILTKNFADFNLDVSKYYLISAYVKNGNATNVAVTKNSSGGGSYLASPVVASTSVFTRAGLVVKPSDLNAGNSFGITVSGQAGQYAYCDGIMINEITSDEYALGVDAMLAKYPYTESYGCLQNPYIEIRHGNLVRNGSCEEGVSGWQKGNLTTDALTVSSGKFKLVTTTASQNMFQLVPVKPNTDYVLSANISGAYANIRILDSTGSVSIREGVGSFNSGSNTMIQVAMQFNLNDSGGTAYYDSIQVAEGNTAPAYSPCVLERIAIEGKFAEGDVITVSGGEVSGTAVNKHRTATGNAYDWQFGQSFTGSKSIYIPYYSLSNKNHIAFSEKVVKWDGKVMAHQDVFSGTVTDVSCLNANGDIYLEVPSTDSGWSDAVNPSSNEVKALANGWRAIGQDGSRYVLWQSIYDSSIPPVVPQTTVSTAYTANATTLVVADASKFSVGDTILCSNKGFAKISAISGNTLTLSRVCGAGLVVGDTVTRTDNADGSDTRILSYCANNVANMFEGYQVHFKMTMPETLNDTNALVHGTVPRIDTGDNYLLFDCGIVLGESITLTYYNDARSWNYKTNSWYNDALRSTYFRYRTERIISIFRGEQDDTGNWMIKTGDGYAYGMSDAYLLSGKYDGNVQQYSADYKIYACSAPSIGSIDCSFTEDIVSILNVLIEEAKSRQTQDKTLDDLISMSEYEVMNIPVIWTWIVYEGVVFLNCSVRFKATKKTIPNLTLPVFNFQSDGLDLTKKFSVVPTSITTDGFDLNAFCYDPVAISSIQSKGAYSNGLWTIIADCKGKV